MEFRDILGNAKGWLEISRLDLDGTEEIIFSDNNVVCSGMGSTLAHMFSSSGVDVSSFQINLFQVGVSGDSSFQVSSTVELSSALGANDYGSDAVIGLDKYVRDIVNGATAQTLLLLPQTYVNKVDVRTVRWNFILDENTANGFDLNEIGMFSNDPTAYTPGASKPTYLCAYRFFGDSNNDNRGIWKTNQFSLIFRWTIEF